MSLPRATPRRATHGFTLLEVLAAAAVLMLMMALLLRITGGVSDSVSRQAKRIEATGTARRALDTLAQDIYVLVRQDGATLLFKAGNETENDALKFLCLSRPAPGTDRPRFSFVSYAVESRKDPAINADVPMLIRGDESVSWPMGNESAVAGYDFAAVLNRQVAHGHVASEGVFRFEILWLRKDGVICREPPMEDAATIGLAPPSGYRRVDLSKVSGFIATVACLDRQSQVVEAGFDFHALQKTFAALPVSTADAGTNPLEKWTGEIAHAQPPRVRENIRFIQRTYYLP